MSEDERGLSRRGLIGLFGRSVRGFADSLEGRPEAPAEPYPAHERRLRPLTENVEAVPAEEGGWTVEVSLDPGVSVRVFGVELPEEIVLVCVHTGHHGACSSECPVDGSDLVWSPEDDRLRCPACGSLWRLDGVVSRGPADSDLARYLVDPTGRGVHIRPL